MSDSFVSPAVIKNHWLEDAERMTTLNRSGEIRPEVIVVHDTAGRDAASSAAWLCNKTAKASAHLVVGRDGELYQLAPFNIGTWHAGKSVYEGRANVNGFSIGIEFDNPGKLSHQGETARAWFGTRYDIEKHGIEWAKTVEHGEGGWMPYTDVQLALGMDIVAGLVAKYPSIKDVVPHWFISPGRKIDTNPLFPLDKFKNIVTGRGGNQASTDVPRAETTAEVNIRRWPTNNDNIIRALPMGERVRVIRSGWFAEGFPMAEWFLVETSVEEQGWVHSFYLRPPRSRRSSAS